MRDCNKSRDKNLYSTKLVRYLVEIHKGYIRWWETGGGGRQIRLQRKVGSIRWGSQERLLWQSVPRKWSGKVQIPGRGAQQSRKGLTQTCCCLIWATGGARSDAHWVFSTLSVPSMVCFLSAIKAMLNWTCADPIPPYSCPSKLPPSYRTPSLASTPLCDLARVSQFWVSIITYTYTPIPPAPWTSLSSLSICSSRLNSLRAMTMPCPSLHSHL